MKQKSLTRHIADDHHFTTQLVQHAQPAASAHLEIIMVFGSIEIVEEQKAAGHATTWLPFAPFLPLWGVCGVLLVKSLDQLEPWACTCAGQVLSRKKDTTPITPMDYGYKQKCTRSQGTTLGGTTELQIVIVTALIFAALVTPLRHHP